MLNLVPLAGAGWEVTHGDGEPRARGELLQSHFQRRRRAPLLPPRIGGDHQRPGLTLHRASHVPPPPPDRLHGEGGGVVIDADTHPAFIAVEIIDAVRNGLAAGGGPDHEVVDLRALRGLPGAPRPPGVLEVADQTPSLGIDRNGGLSRPLRGADPTRDVGNWASRSACWRPSRVLTFPCRL